MSHDTARHRGLDMSMLLALYAVQAIPMAFFSTLLPILLRQESYSLLQIALLQLVKLPWILKFLWAPWVDRRTRSLSQLRRSIVWSELVYAGFLLVLSTLSLEVHLPLILVLVLLSFVASSVQDIAVDKYAILLLADRERSIGNAMQSGGNFIGSLVGAGLLVAVYYYVGWVWCVLALSAVVALVLPPFVWLYRRRGAIDRQVAAVVVDGSAPLPKGLPTLVGYLRREVSGRYLVLLMLYYMPIVPLMVLVKPLLVDWQFDLQTVAMLVGVWGAGVAALASFASGVLVRRLSPGRMLSVVYAVAVVVGALLVVLSRVTPSIGWAMLAVGALWASYALATVVLYTIAMGRVRRGLEGTDFTLQTIVAQLGAMISAAVVGRLGDLWGYTIAFALVAGLALVVYLGVWRGYLAPDGAARS